MLNDAEQSRERSRRARAIIFETLSAYPGFFFLRAARTRRNKENRIFIGCLFKRNMLSDKSFRDIAPLLRATACPEIHPVTI